MADLLHRNSQIDPPESLLGVEVFLGYFHRTATDVYQPSTTEPPLEDNYAMDINENNELQMVRASLATNPLRHVVKNGVHYVYRLQP